MKEFTPKEIESIGGNRYLKANNRIAIAIAYALCGLALALVSNLLLDSHLYDPIPSVIAVVIMLIGVGFYSKIVIWDASKAGKKFYAEYMKEKQP